MALFGLPTPQEVRQQARQRLFERAQTPAQQVGTALGIGMAGLFGAQLPQEKKAAQIQQIAQGVQSQFPDTIQSPQQMGQMGTMLAGELMKAGFQAESAGVLQNIKGIAPQAKERKIIKDVAGFQRFVDTGERVFEGVEPRAQKPLVDIDIGDKPFLKQLASKTSERMANAEIAAKSFDTTRNMKQLLDEGVITGFGSEFITGVGNALQQLGFDTGDAVGNTQAYAGAVGKLVANVIRDFGAGTGLSDADREFALSIAAGRTSMTEKALRRLIKINDKASEAQIRFHNKAVDRLPKSISNDVRASFKVAMPPRGIGKPVARDPAGREVFKHRGKYIYSDGQEYRP